MTENGPEPGSVTPRDAEDHQTIVLGLIVHGYGRHDRLQNDVIRSAARFLNSAFGDRFKLIGEDGLEYRYEPRADDMGNHPDFEGKPALVSRAASMLVSHRLRALWQKTIEARANEALRESMEPIFPEAVADA